MASHRRKTTRRSTDPSQLSSSSNSSPESFKNRKRAKRRSQSVSPTYTAAGQMAKKIEDTKKKAAQATQKRAAEQAKIEQKDIKRRKARIKSAAKVAYVQQKKEIKQLLEAEERKNARKEDGEPRTKRSPSPSCALA